MRLIPKAKPVRIRITSGNEEHFSLESLRKNFVWGDIKKLFEGDRLDKWLRRIDADEIADRLQVLHHTEDNALEVYNILFRGDQPFSTAEDVFNEYSKGDRGLIHLATQLIENIETSMLINMADRSAFKDLMPTFIYHLINRANQLDDINSADQLFKIGLILAKDAASNEIALSYIHRASESGNEKAQEYLRKIDPCYRLIEREENVLNNISTQKRLTYSWRNLTFIESIIKYRTKQKLLDDYKELYQFSDNCLRLFMEANAVAVTANELSSIAKRIITVNDDNPIFNDEKLFVLALMETDAKKAIMYLKKIKNKFPPAEIMINSSVHSLYIHNGEINCYFRLGQRYIRDNAKNLMDFILNLNQFRNYEPGK